MSLTPYRRTVSLITTVLVACVAVPSAVGATSSGVTSAARKAAGDAVVVAVIDSGFSPYHWDFLASKMPQAGSSAALPLTKSPDTWVPGFPRISAFRSFNRFDLSLKGRDEDASMKALHDKDAAKWSNVKSSGPSGVNYYWFPGTKVIGAMSFDYESQVQKTIDTQVPDPFTLEPYTYIPIYGTGGAEHGMGTSSVSVGNIHGTCPECLLVFIQAADTAATERALAWAEAQPWIDVISNSYGLQTVPTGLVRDGLYGGPTDGQRAASERGQTIVFSAGNGIENAFAVPFSTLTSSVKGPDWVITVGATDPSSGANFSGSGKPVDVSGIGDSYPSAYGSTRVTGGSRFSGTSNAAPTIAGTYARGLFLARQAMAGPSRVQRNGVISVGPARCGSARPACEVRDGVLTAVELRDRLFKGAVSTGKGISPAGAEDLGRIADEHYADEGHGTYYARLKDDTAVWLKEFNRFFLPVVGRAGAVPRPADEAAWFRVDSWCRQHIFGAWNGGYFKNDTLTPLPGVDPSGHPVRMALQLGCNGLVKLPIPPPLP